MPTRQSAIRIPEKLGVIVSMKVNKTRRNNASFCINHTLSVRFANSPNGFNTAVVYPDVSDVSRNSRAIYDHATFYNSFIFHCLNLFNVNNCRHARHVYKGLI